MTGKIIGLSLAPWLLAAGLAVAAEPERGQNTREVKTELAREEGEETETASQARIYEDVEILRRLLIGKIVSVYVPSSRASTLGFYSPSPTYPSPNNSVLLWGGSPDGKSRTLDLEGTYFKGQGVVYSVTLPLPARDPRKDSGKDSARTLSDWERTRKEIHHENVSGPEKPNRTKSPSLTEVILQVLHQNGRHFTPLSADESLTVAITFRGDRRATWTGGGLRYSTTYTEMKRADPNVNFFQNNPYKTGDVSRDYELLGDLHMKQGKVQEALQAFTRAHRESRSGEKKTQLLRRIAQVYLALGKDAEAAHILEALRKGEKKLPDDKKNGKARAADLPPKLIITVSKKLIESAAANKLTFAEFRKQAKVQYLNFPAAAK
jgi:hypothetical protein